MHEQNENAVYEFEGFRVDVLRRQLVRLGTALPLTSKSFDTLLFLIRYRGSTVSKAELMNSVWADTAVEENNLTQQISALRRTFGERRDDHRFIVTVPGKGYSFVADVCTDIVEKAIDPPTQRSSNTIRLPFDRSAWIGYAYAVSYILLIGIIFLWSSVRYHSDGHRQSLAVLDFRATATGDEFISTGISDTLRARLGSVQDLIVLRDGTARPDQDVLSAGRRLQVGAVVTGSVQRDHDRIRVAVELLNTADGRIVWSKTFDDSASNLFALQDAIAGEIARVLNVSIASHSDRWAPAMYRTAELVFHTGNPKRQFASVIL